MSTRVAEWLTEWAVPEQLHKQTNLGRVVRGDKGWVQVETPTGVGPARTNKRRRAAVGDWVRLEDDPGGDLVVAEVFPRKSQLLRNTGRGNRTEVVATNIDLVLIVHSLSDELNLRRLERELLLVVGAGAQARVVLNKADLAGATEQAQTIEALSIKPPIIASCVSGQGLTELESLLGRGTTVSLIGSSGVGKTTLARILEGEIEPGADAIQPTGNEELHKTSARSLVRTPSGAFLVDNPGTRSVSLVAEVSDLEIVFPEVANVDCKFRDCRHDGSKGCGLPAALDSGKITQERLDHYHELLQELEEVVY